MIYCNTNGGRKSERTAVEDAFWFAVEELMPKKKNLDVEFYLQNLEGDVDGFHEFIDRGMHVIELQKNLDIDDLVTAVFHEMVHVRQYERGQGGFDESTPYLERPCEIEAYHLQEELFDKWKHQHSESH